jgi:hypothetical protein
MAQTVSQPAVYVKVLIMNNAEQITVKPKDIITLHEPKYCIKRK